MNNKKIQKVNRKKDKLVVIVDNISLVENDKVLFEAEKLALLEQHALILAVVVRRVADDLAHLARLGQIESGQIVVVLEDRVATALDQQHSRLALISTSGDVQTRVAERVRTIDVHLTAI